MKRLMAVITIIVVVQSLFFIDSAEGVNNQIAARDNRGILNNAPDHIVGPALIITSSQYDYFFAGHKSFSFVKQHSPVGMFPGGGLYHIFSIHITPGNTRRAYYIYMIDGEIVSGAYINPNAPANAVETLPTASMDDNRGNPFFSWVDTEGHILFCFDQYSAMGYPGLFNAGYTVFDTTDIYSQPVIKVGNSPIVGMKRVYICVSGREGVKYLAYADYLESSDIEDYNPEGWTVYEIPYTRAWGEQRLRSYDDFIVTDDGKTAIVGTLESIENYQDDRLFVLVNSDYGEGSNEEDWTLHEQSALIQTINPDGYFQGIESRPRSLFIKPHAPRFNAVVSENGNIMIPLTYRLFIPEAGSAMYVKDQGYIKLVTFSFTDESFEITDIYPRSLNPEAFPYVPWDPEGDGNWEYEHTPEDSFLVVQHSWPVYWWGEEDYYFENYVRITQTGQYAAILFQESMKARYFYEYDIPEYEGQDGEVHIVISDDYGQSWYDPIIMNTHPQDDNTEPALFGKIVAYIYPADKISIIDNSHIRMHLSFFDHNDYGSSVFDNSPPTGGTITYMPVDIILQETGIEDNNCIAERRLNLSNYPNPFNPNTTIFFNLPQNANTKLSVYNIRGQLIKTLTDSKLQAGNHSYVWNGRDSNNREVSSGVYFYRLESELFSETKRMLLIK